MEQGEAGAKPGLDFARHRLENSGTARVAGLRKEVHPGGKSLVHPAS